MRIFATGKSLAGRPTKPPSDFLWLNFFGAKTLIGVAILVGGSGVIFALFSVATSCTGFSGGTGSGVLELVMFLEDTFSIQVDDEELVPENLETINNQVAFLKQKGVS